MNGTCVKFDVYDLRKVCHARLDRDDCKDAKYNTRTKFFGRDIFMTEL